MKTALRKVLFLGVLPVLCIAFFSVLFTARPVDAQEQEISNYPNRPISCIVPFSPGGSADVALRLMSKELEKYLGQPFVVVNKPGGGGSIGVSAVSVAKPDGYTIGQSPGGAPLFIMPYTEKIPYNPVKDVRYIIQFVDLTFGVVVSADSPLKTFKDLIAHARKNPGKTTYATNAPLSIANLVMEQVARKEKVQLTHIPFKSSPEYQSAVLGGHVLFSAGDFNYALLESGKTKLLAFLSEKAPQEYAQVPTLRELGYDVPCPVFLGILGPKGLPDEIVRKLEDAFAKTLKEPAVTKGLKELHLTMLYRNNKDLTDYVRKNYDAFGQMLREMGLAKQ
jgi:tripartite-type tricarboxylate transporter receptor subunit TctC